MEMEQALQKYHDLSEHLEEYLDNMEFNEKLVDELVNKIYVGSDQSIEIIFNCEDVFQNTLIDEYISSFSDDGVGTEAGDA